MSAGEDLQAALDRLAGVVGDLVRRAESVSVERCPHRDRQQRCHWQRGCRNQVRGSGDTLCRDDDGLRRSRETR